MDVLGIGARWGDVREEREVFECVLCPNSFGWFLLGNEDMRTAHDEDGTSCAVGSSIALDEDTI